MSIGKFIVLEGIDGSGKSYQTVEVTKRLKKKKFDVMATEEPWYKDSIGRLIKKALYDKSEGLDVRTLQLLYVANRSNHVEKIIKPNLESGKNVISSRYWMSTAVYGSAFCKDESVDMNYFVSINEIFPKPDAVFNVVVDPEEASRRLSEQRQLTDRFEKLELIKVQSEEYKRLEIICKQKGMNWININGNQEKDKVTGDIIVYCESLLSKD